MAHVEAQCLPFGPKWVLKKKGKMLGNKMQTTQWLKWRHNAYLLAKYGCKSKKQERKS